MEDKKEEKCEGKMEIYSRVVGFYRPVGAWNKGKEAEWADRKTYDTPEATKEAEYIPTARRGRPTYDLGKLEVKSEDKGN